MRGCKGNGAAFMRAGASPDARRHMYFRGCLVVRALLAVALIIAGGCLPMPALVTALWVMLVLCLIGVVVNYRIGDSTCRWWSPPRNAVIAGAIAATAAAGCSGLVPPHLAMSAAGGIIAGNAMAGARNARLLKPWG
jgi:hypothetical protein